MVESGREKEYHDGEKWLVREIANEIENRHKFKCVENGENRTLYCYHGGVWKPNGETVVESEALSITNELLRPGNINQVVRIIKNRNRVQKENFQMQDYIIPFENGVYDLKENRFKDHDPGFNLKYMHPICYVEEFSEPQLKTFRMNHDPNLDDDAKKIPIDKESRSNEFLDSLVNTERKLSILKETIGLALMTNYPIQEAPILYGKGKNGKNMYVKMLKEMSGRWHSLDLSEFTDDQFAKAEMQGSSFVFFDELGHIKDPNKLKSFIGEEDMRIREMQSLGYMGKQRAIPIMAGNDIPTPPEQTKGFFRRFCIIDFPHTFTNEDDQHKDQIPKKEIQERYFNKYDLSLLATQIVKELKPVLDQEGFTESYSSEQKRQIWNLKSSTVYTFLNLFVEQGDLPDKNPNKACDSIVKSDLLELCNSFVNELNGTKVRQHELTQAIENNPDLEKGKDVRKEGKDGKEHRAYSGLKTVIPQFQHIQGLDDLEAAHNSVLLQHSEKFEVLSAEQYIRTLEVSETKIEAKVIKFIRESNSSSLSLLRIVKGLKLSESDIQDIYDSDYLNVEGKIAEGFAAPKITIDSEALDSAIEDSDKLVEDMEGLKRPNDWLHSELDSWSSQTVVDKQELIDKALEKGFNEKSIEETIKQFERDGILYNPDPGKLQKL